jgi:short-subunit dehydrogenase
VAAPGSVVISGTTRGLGAALALRFAAPGVTLGLVARGAAALARVAGDCEARGAAVRTAALDLRDPAALPATMLAWDEALPVDLVVANAGATGGTAPDGTAEGWEDAVRLVETNLLGAMNLVGPLLPRMLARRRGGIGLIASVAAFRGLPDTPAYCASKAGLWAWGESLRAAHGRRGIAVTVVAPGFFPSAMSERFLGGKPLQMSLDAVADRVHRALLAGKGRAVFPWPLAALLRGIELLPAPAADFAIRRFRVRIAPEAPR